MSFNEQLTNYIVGIKIGEGSYATVRKGMNKLTNKEVAIKVYEKSKLINAQRKLNVKKEIRILKKVNHPNIVKFHEVVNTTNNLYLIMEFIKGKSLTSYIRDTPLRRLKESEAIRLFKQVLEAIKYCHDNMISHRDIKADNVLVKNKGEVKLIDFGFSTLSKTNQLLDLFCGTPYYMPPEITCRKEYIGTNTDIWSLGVLFYFMLSGNLPFDGKTDKDLFKCIARGHVLFPSYFSSMSKEFILKMLQVDPNKRATAMEVFILY